MNRGRVFTRRNRCYEEIGKQYIGLLAEKAIVFHFKVWAYCFMPDHVHFLAEGIVQDAHMRKFVSSFKQSTGYHFSKSIKADKLFINARAEALGCNLFRISIFGV